SVLIAIFANGAICADDADRDEDGDVAQGANAPLVVRYVNQSIFGNRDEGSAAAARRELSLYLRQTIAETDLICGLTEKQREKLHLAGGADLKRLFDPLRET